MLHCFINTLVVQRLATMKTSRRDLQSRSHCFHAEHVNNWCKGRKMSTPMVNYWGLAKHSLFHWSPLELTVLAKANVSQSSHSPERQTCSVSGPNGPPIGKAQFGWEYSSLEFLSSEITKLIHLLVLHHSPETSRRGSTWAGQLFCNHALEPKHVTTAAVCRGLPQRTARGAPSPHLPHAARGSATKPHSPEEEVWRRLGLRKDVATVLT